MATTTPLYASLMTAFERRRQRLGWTFEVLDEASGVGEGVYAKLLHVTAQSGRRGGWEMLQLLADALYTPGKYEVHIIDKSASMPTIAGKSETNTRIPKNMRVVLAGMASAAGKARMAKLTPVQRSELSRAAAEARWRRVRATPGWSGSPSGTWKPSTPAKPASGQL